MTDTTVFSKLPDDVVLNIFFKLEDDPRDWARLACVSAKFSSLIRNTCWQTKCSNTIPTVVADLLASSSAPPGGWSSLYKLAVCCPGLLHAGVLLENSDFGLERELGPDENYQQQQTKKEQESTLTNGNNNSNDNSNACLGKIKIDGDVLVKTNNNDVSGSGSGCSWSLYDDLYFDTVYNLTENPQDENTNMNMNQNPVGAGEDLDTEKAEVKVGREFSACKRRKFGRLSRSHLASKDQFGSRN